MEESLSCKICFESYNFQERRPKFLGSCGHTFCLRCVYELYRKSLRVTSNKPECPVCRVEFDQTPEAMKDNYDLMELLSCKSEDKSPKFWCQDCLKVASDTCVNKHCIRSFPIVLAEKVSQIKENFHAQISVERDMLIRLHNSRKSALEAVEEIIVKRLQSELDFCQNRLQEIEQIAGDITLAHQTVTSNGDIHLLDALQTLTDNQLERQFLCEQIDIQDQLSDCKLTLSHADWARSFTLGQSLEDEIFKYLLSMIVVSPLKDTAESSKKTVPTKWMPSPWLSRWSDKGFNKEQTDKSNVVYDSDVESATSEAPEVDLRSSHQLYICDIRNENATFGALKVIFAPEGEVVSTKFHRVGKNKKSPWICFVEFQSERSVKQILEKMEVFKRDYGFTVKKRLFKKSKVRNSQQNHQISEENGLDVHHNTEVGLLSDLDEDDERKIFVQSLPPDFPEHRIYEVFSKYGPVKNAVMNRKSYPGAKARAFGFVTFHNKSSVDDVLKVPGKKIFYSGPEYDKKVALEYRAYYNKPAETSKRDSRPMKKPSCLMPSSSSGTCPPLFETSHRSSGAEASSALAPLESPGTSSGQAPLLESSTERTSRFHPRSSNFAPSAPPVTNRRRTTSQECSLH